MSAALGNPKDLAPFFRIPGLYRTDEIDHELAARSLVTFSADVVADDWYHRITPARIIKRAMSRLDKRGKGSILLLHDIHPTTVAALPGLLRELKDHSYRIVQMVPPVPTEPETVGEPKALDSDPAVGASGNIVPISIKKISHQIVSWCAARSFAAQICNPSAR